MNRAPEAVPFADITIAAGSSSAVVNYADLFTDADGDELTYTLSVSDEKVAQPFTSAASVIFAGIKEGKATVTVTATDTSGASATNTFNVLVDKLQGIQCGYKPTSCPDQLSRALTEAVEAAKRRRPHAFIMELKDGYDTYVGERGVKLSGGQKQRISIARALIKDAPILILDDSVSAVDTQTERAILDNLRRTRQGRTTILIAHRISTVEQMDRIIFLEDGAVTAVGDHAGLYETCPAYRRMVELQKLEEEGTQHNA